MLDKPRGAAKFREPPPRLPYQYTVSDLIDKLMNLPPGSGDAKVILHVQGIGIANAQKVDVQNSAEWGKEVWIS